jgi:hypothetical protein
MTKPELIAQFESIAEDRDRAVDLAWAITDTATDEWKSAMSLIGSLNQAMLRVADAITPNCKHGLLDCWHYRRVTR